MSVSKPLDMVKVSHLNTGTQLKGVFKGISSHLSSYIALLFLVDGIESDPESAVVSCRAEIERKNVKLDIGAKGEHMRVVDNNIGIIKEKVRSIISLLPFRLTTKLLVRLDFLQ